jgi:hypothetical protein
MPKNDDSNSIQKSITEDANEEISTTELDDNNSMNVNFIFLNINFNIFLVINLSLKFIILSKMKMQRKKI